MAEFFRTHDKGLDIFLRLTPRASRDAIGQVEDGADGRAHLAARVRAVPEKGAANAALEKVVAAFLDVPRSSVVVVTGSTARLKTVRVTGPAAELAETLRRQIAAGGDDTP